MTQWLPAAILSMFSFGLWGFFSKITINHIDARSALVFQAIGVIVISVLILMPQQFKTATDPKGISFGLLTGAAYGIGCLFYFIAADRGKLITVVALTALYPLVTIVFSYLLLHETINLKQCMGIFLALGAIYLMSC